ncbi:RING finger protein 148 [Pygocentrus nattereri]|uniref:RING finger protein 148 n=1 Tax=Pygocentrus nattereri TaxID=42514 RepID=UPI001891A7D6|nr:RING finger protein 148 [Pygocentrus nattereri]
MEKDERKSQRFSWIWLALLISQFPAHSRAFMVFWSAYVELRYFSQVTNQSTTSVCECGVYGLDSPLYAESGYVALPNSDSVACSPNITFAVNHKPWIALIKRGNCSHADKIRAAEQEGASAVVIYNIDGTGNSTNPMSHPGTGSTVAIMIGNHMGRQITSLVESGTEVYMSLLVGNPYKTWDNPLWVYVMSFTFFGITAIILGYFVFVVIKRLYRNRQLRIQQRELKKVAERAIAKLQVRTLRRTDPEVEAEENNCAVCIDPFKRGDIVTTLPCSHLFHKTCIEPWLLEHHTCPMCKYDILKGEVGVEPTQESSMPPADVRFYPSSVSGSLTETPDVVRSLEQQAEARPGLGLQTAECAIQLSNHIYEEPYAMREGHIYENPTFEEEQQITEYQDSNQQTHQV